MKELEPINHALFVDDSLMSGGASCRIASTYKSSLQAYCKALEALINERKSAIYSWNVEESNIQKFSCILGFKGYSKWDKINYLGLPLTLGINRCSLWEGVLSKIKSKIEFWGEQWLMHGGKLTLIK